MSLPDLSALALTPTEYFGPTDGLQNLGKKERRGRKAESGRNRRRDVADQRRGMPPVAGDSSVYNLLKYSQPHKTVTYVWRKEGAPDCTLFFKVKFYWDNEDNEGPWILWLEIRLMTTVVGPDNRRDHWNMHIKVMEWDRNVLMSGYGYLAAIRNELDGQNIAFEPDHLKWRSGNECPPYKRMAARYIMATSDILQQLLPNVSSVILTDEEAIYDYDDIGLNVMFHVTMLASAPDSALSPLEIVQHAARKAVEKAQWRLIYYVNTLGAKPKNGFGDYITLETALAEDTLGLINDFHFGPVLERVQGNMIPFERIGKKIREGNTEEKDMRRMFKTIVKRGFFQEVFQGELYEPFLYAHDFDLELLHAKERLLQTNTVDLYHSRQEVLPLESGWLPW